jgi:hypothetical protein
MIEKLIKFGPVIIYNIYFFATKEPNSGYDFSAVVWTFIITIISAEVAKKIKNKSNI